MSTVAALVPRAHRNPTAARYSKCFNDTEEGSVHRLWRRISSPTAARIRTKRGGSRTSNDGWCTACETYRLTFCLAAFQVLYVASRGRTSRKRSKARPSHCRGDVLTVLFSERRTYIVIVVLVAMAEVVIRSAWCPLPYTLRSLQRRCSVESSARRTYGLGNERTVPEDAFRAEY